MANGRFSIAVELQEFLGERVVCLAVLLVYAAKDALGNLGIGTITKSDALEILQMNAISMLTPMRRLKVFDDYQFVCDGSVNTPDLSPTTVAFEIVLKEKGGKLLGLSRPFTAEFDPQSGEFALGVHPNLDLESPRLKVVPS